MGRFITHSLLATLYLSTTGTAQSHLFARQQPTCPANFSKCTQPGLPSNFCCPSTSKCIPLAANTTVLCCPAGSDCAQIASITCDISQQDAVANPSNTLKTTALTGTLGKCGTRCCPFGYSCNKQNNCEIDANQDIPPVQSSSTSSLLPSSTTSIISTPTNAAPQTTSEPNTACPSTTALPLESQSCPRFPTLSIIIFFFAGLLTGIALTMFTILIITKCHQKRQTSHLRRASTQSFGNTNSTLPISSPHLQNGSARTDFLRKKEWDGGSPSTLGGRARPGTIKRVKSLFMRDKTPKIADGGWGREEPLPPSLQISMPPPLNIRKVSDTQTQTAQLINPVTPPQQRAPSAQDLYADINIYTDGETASALRKTNKETGQGLGIGNGNTMAAGGQGSSGGGGKKAGAAGKNLGGLLPPPAFLLGGEKSRGSGVSGQTTFTQLIEKSRDDGGSGKKSHQRTSSGLAGLQKGQPYIYKGSPSYSDSTTARDAKIG